MDALNGVALNGVALNGVALNGVAQRLRTGQGFGRGGIVGKLKAGDAQQIPTARVLRFTSHPPREPVAPVLQLRPFRHRVELQHDGCARDLAGRWLTDGKVDGKRGQWQQHGHQPSRHQGRTWARAFRRHPRVIVTLVVGQKVGPKLSFDLRSGAVIQVSGLGLRSELREPVLVERPDHGICIRQRIRTRLAAFLAQQRPGCEEHGGERERANKHPEHHLSSRMDCRRAVSWALSGSAAGWRSSRQRTSPPMIAKTRGANQSTQVPGRNGGS